MQSANSTLFLTFNFWHFPYNFFPFVLVAPEIVLFDRLNIYLWYTILWRCGIYSVISNYVIIKI